MLKRADPFAGYSLRLGLVAAGIWASLVLKFNLEFSLSTTARLATLGFVFVRDTVLSVGAMGIGWLALGFGVASVVLGHKA